MKYWSLIDFLFHFFPIFWTIRNSIEASGVSFVALFLFHLTLENNPSTLAVDFLLVSS
jgi:hypothetical protein